MNPSQPPAARRCAAKPQGRGLVAATIGANRSSAFYIERAQARRVPACILYGPPRVPPSVRQALWQRHVFIGNACIHEVAALTRAAHTVEGRALNQLIADTLAGGAGQEALTARLQEATERRQTLDALHAEIRERLPTVDMPAW